MTADLAKAWRMFAAARSHVAGAQLIMQSDGITGHGLPALPVIIISAFAIELFLKACLVARGAAVPKVHDLHALWMRLESIERESITQRFLSRPNVPEEVRSMSLQSEKDAFVEWRYVHDGNDGSTRPLFFFEFAIASHDHLVAKFPEWLTMPSGYWLPVPPRDG